MASEDTRIRVLLAVVEIYERRRFGPTYTEILEVTGIGSKQTLHAALHRLRADGFVSFEDGVRGSLRPLVTLIPLR